MSNKERAVAMLEATFRFCVAVTKGTAEESTELDTERLQYLASRLEELRAEIPRPAAG